MKSPRNQRHARALALRSTERHERHEGAQRRAIPRAESVLEIAIVASLIGEVEVVPEQRLRIRSDLRDAAGRILRREKVDAALEVCARGGDVIVARIDRRQAERRVQVYAQA